MANQKYNLFAGSLRGVQASGVGTGWATATSPSTCVYGFSENFTFTSAQTIVTQSDRGTPKHHAIGDLMPIDISFDVGYTGGVYAPNTASGAQLPLQHLEYRSSAIDIAPASAFYYQFYGFAVESVAMKEGKDGNVLSYKGKALAMLGPTASGYLS